MPAFLFTSHCESAVADEAISVYYVIPLKRVIASAAGGLSAEGGVLLSGIQGLFSVKSDRDPAPFFLWFALWKTVQYPMEIDNSWNVYMTTRPMIGLR